MYKLWVLA